MSHFHRSSSAGSATKQSFKFPSLANDGAPRYSEEVLTDGDDHSPSVALSRSARQWQPRRSFRDTYAEGGVLHPGRRARQKSLSEALRNIHNRRASMSENAQELAEALKAPVSPKLVILCAIWYMTSIFTNASSKSILIAFRYPVTLTIVQFAFVTTLCIISSSLAHAFPVIQTMVPALKYRILPPSRELIMTVLPLTAFQIGGHILNSDAMSRIPVSLVHTIKGLSPLFTVLAYRLIFRVHYSIPTYLSLIPLTAGVVMACSADFSGNLYGLVLAFGSALLFVTQNIVSKKLFNEAARAEAEGVQQYLSARKPDKLNMLCYSSALAFILTCPIWLWSDGYVLIRDFLFTGTVELSKRPDALDHGRLAIEFIFNGTFHFAQSLVAFVLLSMVSPVTYSVASLMKRVFVISFAIVWFGNPMSLLQGFGIGLTFVGLYLYDKTSDAARGERRANKGRLETPLLPVNEEKKADVHPANVGTTMNGVAGSATHSRSNGVI